MKFYNFLKKFRELNGFTQKEIAKVMETSQSRISNIENCNTLPDEEFIRMFIERFEINDELKKDLNIILKEMGIDVNFEPKIEITDVIKCVFEFLTEDQKKIIAQEIAKYL